MINVEVEKNPNESTLNLVRRFTKRVQGAGIIYRMRKIRYRKRDASPYTKKKRAIKAHLKKVEIERLIKLGKMPEKVGRR